MRTKGRGRGSHGRGVLWMAAIPAMILVTGCVRVRPHEDYQQAIDRIARQTGAACACDPESDGLVAEQSKLLSNPTLALGVMFPEGGGRSKLNGGIGQELADLWQIPVRKKIAGKQLESTVLNVVDSAVNLVGIEGGYGLPDGYPVLIAGGEDGTGHASPNGG